MQGFPVKRRGARGWLAAAVAGLAAAGLAAPGAAESGRQPALREASRPGAFCTPWSCRPRATSGWTAAAFGAVVVAMGWQARRREHAGPPTGD